MSYLSSDIDPSDGSYLYQSRIALKYNVILYIKVSKSARIKLQNGDFKGIKIRDIIPIIYNEKDAHSLLNIKISDCKNCRYDDEISLECTDAILEIIYKKKK